MPVHGVVKAAHEAAAEPGEADGIPCQVEQASSS